MEHYKTFLFYVHIINHACYVRKYVRMCVHGKLCRKMMNLYTNILAIYSVAGNFKGINFLKIEIFV